MMASSSLAPDLKEEDSVDMVLEDSKEPLTPSSPPTGRGKALPSNEFIS